MKRSHRPGGVCVVGIIVGALWLSACHKQAASPGERRAVGPRAVVADTGHRMEPGWVFGPPSAVRHGALTPPGPREEALPSPGERVVRLPTPLPERPPAPQGAGAGGTGGAQGDLAPTPSASGAEAAPRTSVPSTGSPRNAPLRDVFFDFDDATIREDQRGALDAAAAWLRANPAARLTIEGYCDERGTTEYNLALGERRAAAAKGYLTVVGIAADRIRIVSYGEERPFVLGHDETIWRWNRRAHLVAGPPE